ncbi:MAG: Transmembrane protein, partial [Candidatus Wolfebacteria bacterium GW2011_GWA2_47_9b]
MLFSVILHEVSHGLAALRLGDETAKHAGRLTLNPLKHLDAFGSFILPISLYILSGGGFILGWAKPVPYNPFNLKNPKLGAGIIAAIGPASNLLIAIVFGIILRLIFPFVEIPLIANLAILFSLIIFINILLAVFNLVPLPPLDGSNILFALLPERWRAVRDFLVRYGFWLL